MLNQLRDYNVVEILYNHNNFEYTMTRRPAGLRTVIRLVPYSELNATHVTRELVSKCVPVRLQ